MLLQKQLNLHKPEQGIYGDCYRTAIACLLDLRAEDVPNWAEQWYLNPDAQNDPAGNWMVRQAQAWLQEQGYDSVGIPFPHSLKHVLQATASWFPKTYFILTGKSTNETHHCVICQGGEIIWDPALDNSGIVGPCDDGFLWVEVITPFFARDL